MKTILEACEPRSEVLQRDVASPKRSKAERCGLHAWHPYYAGFSEAFATNILSELRVDPGQLVLDPMNGSGTMTMVAQQHGYLSVGNELNPAMAIMARAKDATFSGQSQLAKLASHVAEQAQHRSFDRSLDEHISAWMPIPAFADLKKLQAELDARQESPLLPLDSRLAALAHEKDAPRGGCAKDLLRAAILMTARRASSAQSSKNPTWLKPGNGAPVAKVAVFDEFPRITASMLSDLGEAFDEVPQARRLLILQANASALPLPASSVDAIVTSPPYLTRIDYAVGTAPELIVLGYESKEHLRALRRETMGSTCVTEGPHRPSRFWGKTCLNTVERVQRHPSKASAGYYFKMHVQYFRDAEAILRECLRVLKPGAPAVFVIQDSWYKDIHIALDKIYIEMAIELGARSAETIQSRAVRNHLGLVNTRARRYRKGAFYEHVVIIRSR